MPRPSELPPADPGRAAAATKGRIGRLALAASEHAAAGRPHQARCARMLMALLQDELDGLDAGRLANGH